MKIFNKLLPKLTKSETSYESKLKELRETVNVETETIISALDRRFKAVEEIGVLKEQYNMPIFDEKREAQVLKLAEGREHSMEIEAILKEIIHASKFAEMKKLKTYGLLGENIEYSFSPLLHKLIGERIGIDYSYNIFSVKENELEDFLKNGEFLGLNVTIPYKERIMKYLDEIDPIAKEIGAVNTVIKRNGRLYGYNTDGKGFIKAVKLSGMKVKGRECLCLGQGGAAKAVKYGLNQLGAKSVKTISVRNLSWMKHYNAEYIFNATPLGTGLNYNEIPLKKNKCNNSAEWVKHFPKLKGVMDLIYNPNRTRFLLQAKDANIIISNGLNMLIAQGLFSAELFLDMDLDWNFSKGNRKKKSMKISLGSMPSLTRLILDIRKKILSENQNIVLIGMPAVGKTSLGKKLAKELNLQFYDVDNYISKKTSKSVEEIFKEGGEPLFRKLENQAVKELAKLNNVIISCGGGTMENAENFYELGRNSIIIFLDGFPLVKNYDEGRPLLKKSSWKKIRRTRLKNYRNRSDIIYNVKKMNTSERVAPVIERIKRTKF